MGYSPRNITDEKNAQKLKHKGLEYLKRLLSFIGRPFYLLFSYLALAFLFVAYITGYATRSLLTAPKLLIKQLSNLKNKALLLINRLLSKGVGTKSGVVFKARKTPLALIKEAKKKALFLKSKLFWLAKKFVDKLKVVLSIIKKSAGFLATNQKVLDKLLRSNINKYSKSISKKAKAFLTTLRLLLLKLKLKTLFQARKIKLPKPSFPKPGLLKSFFIILALLVGTAAALTWQYILKDLPSPESLATRNVQVSTKIYDRNGILLYKIFKEKNRTPIKLDDIPAHTKLATLAIEDSEFYDHIGFSIKGILRATIRNIKRGELSGGSTITQQLVKNALLSSEKTIIRKLREIVLSIQVELTYSKDEILEMYLNEVAYGGTSYGIQEASQMYFGKDARELTLAESALLAGLPKSPTTYSPFGPNPEAAETRQKEVLKLMYINGYITRDEQEKAENEKLKFAENKIDIKAPHFVMYVREKLEEKYGKELVEKGGLNVTTTLDYRIQKLAETVVKEEVESLKNLNVRNGAAVVLNPQTGEVLAMVGSKNYFDKENDGNVNVTTSLRQPGSSIKLINYAHALSNGLTAATIIADSPTSFLVDGQPPYTPRNYEGGYRGNLTLRNAFAESRNIPAVKVLNSYGIDKMIETGKKMGITTWENPQNYGLSLTLGGGEVKLIELAKAYSTIANYGRRPDIVSVLEVEGREGKTLEKFECESASQLKLASTEEQKTPIKRVHASQSGDVAFEVKKGNCNQPQVIDERVAFILTDILKDNGARSQSFGRSSLLNIPEHKEVAVKTGTSNNLRDNLTVGYNQDYLVAVWVGNNDNSPMARIASGITGATPIFHDIMSALLAKEPNDDWPVPEGLVQLPICPITGTLACPGCPVRLEWFLEENTPTATCNPEWFKSKDDEDEDEDEKKEENNQEFIIYGESQIRDPLESAR